MNALGVDAAEAPAYLSILVEVARIGADSVLAFEAEAMPGELLRATSLDCEPSARSPEVGDLAMLTWRPEGRRSGILAGGSWRVRFLEDWRVRSLEGGGVS